MIERIEDTPSGTIGVRATGALGVGHPHAWKRTAVVTDVDWIKKAIHMFTWLVPGEIMVRDLDGLEEAKAWVAG